MNNVRLEFLIDFKNGRGNGCFVVLGLLHIVTALASLASLLPNLDFLCLTVIHWVSFHSDSTPTFSQSALLHAILETLNYRYLTSIVHKSLSGLLGSSGVRTSAQTYFGHTLQLFALL